jgi:3-dehydrosphinganine reductase
MDIGFAVAGGAVALVVAISALQYFQLSFPLKGKVIVITGGSSGIGKAAAKLALRQGAHVALVARTESRLLEAKRELEASLLDAASASASASASTSASPRITVHSADVCNEREMRTALDQAAASHGGLLHAIVASAGMTSCAGFESCSLDEFQRTINTNLIGVRNTILSALPHLSHEVGARIVIISSQAGQLGLYGYTAYSASKFALSGLASALAMELHTRNVKVSVCYPPDTDTPMLHSEDETKHIVTAKISETSTCVQPEVVGSAIVQGIAHHQPHITIGADGWLLSKVSAGCTPQPILGWAIAEMLLLGLFRFLALCFNAYFYRIVSRYDTVQPASEGKGKGNASAALLSEGQVSKSKSKTARRGSKSAL